MTAFEAQLRQCRDLAEDGEGSFILGQCMAIRQAEVFEGCHLTKPFGEQGVRISMFVQCQIEDL